MADQPNILLFVTDDHGQWACGPCGNREVRTPNLDHLARSGVVFENAFTPTPVCSPARASLLTGLTPSQHGIHDYIGMDFDRGAWLEGERTLPQLLQRAGYCTGLAGKWHLGNEERPAPGFDFWFSVGAAYPLLHCGARDYCDQGRMVRHCGYTNDIIAERAVDFLRAADERPYFLLVGLTATHSPWRGHPQRLAALYEETSFAVIPRGESYPFGEQALESGSVDRRREREAQVQYYAAVSHVDEIVGRLLDVTDQRAPRVGKKESTLTVYTSDHGLNCGHHGVWGKGNGTRPLNMLEESIRVPLLMNWPGVLPAGLRREEPVDHLDLFQTVVAAAGAKPPRVSEYPGRSLMTLLLASGTVTEWRSVQFGEYGTVRMARTGQHKLVRRYPGGPHELFDLQRDPRENFNVYESPSHQEVVDHLTERLEAYFERFSIPDNCGLRGAALPQHNWSEAWRQ